MWFHLKSKENLVVHLFYLLTFISNNSLHFLGGKLVAHLFSTYYVPGAVLDLWTEILVLMGLKRNNIHIPLLVVLWRKVKMERDQRTK